MRHSSRLDMRWARPLRRCLIGLLALLGAAVTAIPASAAVPLVRVGSRPQLPIGSEIRSALAPETPIHITVALKPRDPSAMTALATAVSQPGSPRFRRYLTTAQFRRRFGATPAAAAAVRAALQARGLTVGPLSANGLALPATASAGTLQHAFSIVFSRIRLPGGADAVINSLAPALSAAIASKVQDVIGLNNLSTPQSLRRHASAATVAREDASRARVHPDIATGGPQPCAAAATAAGAQDGYTNDQIASTYDFSGIYGAGDLGKGAVVGIYELEPFDTNDVVAYQACYHTAASVVNVAVDGGAGTGAGSGEAALDVEQVIGLAPEASVLVYSGPNAEGTGPGSGPYDIFAAMVDQDKAKVLTNSWGECEAMEGAASAQDENTLFEQAAIQGQTVVSASGDSGSEDCDDGGGLLADNSLAVDDPGAQPFVTGTGGSSLSKLGPPPTETAWNTGGGLAGVLGATNGAGGGGISSFWPMPGYQSGAAQALGVINAHSSGSACALSSGDCREAPDVAADADPNFGYMIYYNGSSTVSGEPVGWQSTGGTSAVSPLYAAIFALADESAGCAGSPIGFANPALYALAGQDYGRYFHDVTSGDNDMSGTNGGLYPATAGYDMATGLGTPDAAQLVAGLCATTVRLASPGTVVSSLHSRVSVALTAAGGKGSTLTYAAQGLPPGVALNPKTGAATGIPSKTGSYTVKELVAGGAAGGQGDTFTWVITAAPTLSAVSLKGVASGRPTLALRVAVAHGAPLLSQLLVSLPSGLSLVRAGAARLSGPNGQRVAVSATGGGRTLKLALRVPTGSASLRVPLRASSGLRTTVGGGKRPALGLGLTATDAAGGVTALHTSARASS